MKKVISIVLALVLALSVGVTAFAGYAPGSDVYDYTKDERLQKVTDYENGEFAWGGYAPAMYQIVTKDMFTLGNLPSKTDEETESTIALQDSTAADPEFEGIAVCAFYAFNCPFCGKANGGTRLSSIYGGSHVGKCVHCQENLPDPATVKIYRFIIVEEGSAHEKLFSSYNLAKYSKDVYGETAAQYGDGKDLPQSYLVWATDPETGEPVYDEAGKPVLDSFQTSGSTKTDTKTGLYLFLVKFQYRTTPLIKNFVGSKYVEIVYKMRTSIAEAWSNLITKVVGG